MQEKKKGSLPQHTYLDYTIANLLAAVIIAFTFGQSPNSEETEGLFVEMKAKGIKLTGATFNILMQAYNRRMQSKIAENLLEEMHDIGLKPNVNSVI
ncbi:hypothetical protein TSUD_219400 [Trifolium subterraneum]|uniref:Pentacotripeptide-repeat region of PRORP domain-containing protein n=1 Tax=Trifolium subterraneum TaxID=3900 RepID=A0A2Z6MQJ2_TRISU|nr:hypothetical protein TSUD_219400 [Trifolium subterraneum]